MIECIILSIIIITFTTIGFRLYYKKKYEYKISQSLEQIKEQYIKENVGELQDQISKECHALINQRDKIEHDINQRIFQHNQLQSSYNKLNEQMREQQARVQTYEADQKLLANERLSAYEADKRAVIDTRIDVEYAEKKKLAEIAHAEAMEKFGEQAANAQATLVRLGQTIEEFAQKQKAINEAIARQRLLEEQQDFYRVCLTEDAISDVSFLQQVRKNLKKPEIIDKIIYDNYIAKPVLEMIKRVLQNTTCSGIYKITCTKTNEIYIGKSTDVKNRWQQHCKSAFNCGTIASSLLHTKMKQYGIENFTFELVEAVPKDQLSEREKFYINFYQTKEVGLNERNG